MSVVKKMSLYSNLEKFFKSPFFLSLTIGIPFCIFKLLFGLVAYRTAEISMDFWLFLFGQIIIIWAIIDIFMNAGRILLNLTDRPDFFDYCTLAQIGRIFNLPSVFLAIDTLISFLIICFMLWSGWIVQLSVHESYMWYFATTLNLVSLSLVSLFTEIMRSKKKVT
ncbi:hypothetical protein L1994_05570 [Methanomicrobium antiquum]|uniref:Uncharacterized protein n=1 Tax=Methanomicrobium antiquum TaxID=487686 RepID=A0AAF0FQR5_9EURY|nr:hypothetical protein [Methanomicrobium antiquum]WFN37852.1 hypothetical protein L1994_05570 [Methanomicrobium antiquum]